MFRKTLTILSLIGLLLSVSAWVMSYWGVERIVPSGAGTVTFNRGCLTFGRWDIMLTPPVSIAQPVWVIHEFWGFRTNWLPRYSNTITGWIVRLPLWIPSASFGCVLLLCWLPGRRQSKRAAQGLCAKCGYDLRASKDRCPECNTLINE